MIIDTILEELAKGKKVDIKFISEGANDAALEFLERKLRVLCRQEKITAYGFNRITRQNDNLSVFQVVVQVPHFGIAVSNELRDIFSHPSLQTSFRTL